MENYFAYLPKQPALAKWGCAMTGLGYTRVRPGQSYPLLAHPVDHHFEWKRGRVLSTYQIVLITEGGGIFETKGAKRQTRVAAGNVIILQPGRWHRYRPDPDSGWTEHWIECEGPVFERAIKAANLTAERGVLHLPQGSEELEMLFHQVHRHAQLAPAGRQAMLATLGPEMVACLEFSVTERDSPSSLIDVAVQRAYHLIASQCHKPFDFQAVANELAVGASHLRHRFKERTGLSPRQHFLESRIRKTRDFLRNTSKSIKEIADILGFDSPAHLSRQFKQMTGSPPGTFRQTTGNTMSGKTR